MDAAVSNSEKTAVSAERPAVGAPPAAPAAAPKKKKRLVPIIGLGGVLLGVAGLGLYLLLAPGAADKAAAAKAGDNEAKVRVVTLRPFLVNLRNTKGTRYLKVTLGMETSSQAVAEDLQKMSPQLSDFLLDKLSEVDITDVDTSAGRNKLKREIMTGMNELLTNGYISAVYFTEFVIQ